MVRREWGAGKSPCADEVAKTGGYARGSGAASTGIPQGGYGGGNSETGSGDESGS